MLAFNFASRIFPYRRLAQGLSRSVFAFSNFMRKNLDPVVKVDQCAQYVVDIGIRVINTTDPTRNNRVAIQCIRQVEFKPTIEMCHFGVRQVEFIGKTISTDGVSPKIHKKENSLKKMRFCESKMDLQRYLVLVNFFIKYIPRMPEKFKLFYKFLKAEIPISVISGMRMTFISENKTPSDACKLTLKQYNSGK